MCNYTPVHKNSAQLVYSIPCYRRRAAPNVVVAGCVGVGGGALGRARSHLLAARPPPPKNAGAGGAATPDLDPIKRIPLL